MIILNDVEEQRYNDFKKNHCGEVKIVLTPTGLGWKIVAICTGCNKTEDISDYDSW